LVGGDGAVHHGFCDVSLLATLPKAALLAPIDEPSMKAAIEFMAGYEQGLSAMRYPRANVDTRLADQPCPAFQLGVARPLVEPAGADVAIIAYGTVAFDALDALPMLPEYRVAVYDARFAKPVDAGLLRRLIQAGTPIVTIEDHSVRGGFGSCVLEACNEMGLDTSRIVRMGLPDAWIGHGERAEQMADAGIDSASIARTVRSLIDSFGCGAPRRSEPTGSHAQAGTTVRTIAPR
jgi:1-deoxy-D-xylulose-5-phosphate synthase